MLAENERKENARMFACTKNIKKRKFRKTRPSDTKKKRGVLCKSSSVEKNADQARWSKASV